MAEALHLLLVKAERQGLIKGYTFLENEPSITHLQFADDTLLILQADETYTSNLRSILLMFAICSGLKINFHKSELFPLQSDTTNIEALAASLGCNIGSLPTKYLGMPLGDCPNRIKFWDPILQKMKDKLSNGKRRNLSFGGRIVLINAVLSSLPMYYMSIFKVPKTVIKNMDRVRRNFLWGTKEEKRVFAKVSWAKVCTPKKKGGLGIANLEIHNLALLGKWNWRYATEPSALWCKIIKSKYGTNPQQWLPNRSKIKEASQIWKSILNTQIIEESKIISGYESFNWSPRDGQTILFWWDRWVGDYCLKSVYPRLFGLALNKEASLAEILLLSSEGLDVWLTLFRRQLREWELQQLTALMSECRNAKLDQNRPDRIIWSWNKKGNYSVKLAAAEMLNSIGNGENFDFFKIWKLKIPSKVQAFLWLLSLNRIASKEFLKQRGMKLNDQEIQCARCNSDIENANHIFLTCQESKDVWARFNQWWRMDFQWPDSTDEIWILLLNPQLPKHLEIRWWAAVSATLWTIRLSRNEASFEKKISPPDQLEFLFKHRAFQWIRASNAKEKIPTDANWWANPRLHQSFGTSTRPECLDNAAHIDIEFEFEQNLPSESKAGVGGIMRNKAGELLAIMNGNISNSDNLAVQIEALMIISNKLAAWASLYKIPLHIRSSAIALVEGIKASELRPSSHRQLFSSLITSLSRFENYEISQSSPDILQSAQNLAKMGKNKAPGIAIFWIKADITCS